MPYRTAVALAPWTFYAHKEYRDGTEQDAARQDTGSGELLMPRRKGGLWLPLDVNFMEDDRIVEVGEKPSWLYLAMCLASKRLGTDGILSSRQVERLHVPGWRARLTPLIRLQLVVDLGGDLWGIAAWLRHNEPQAKIEQKRAVDREYQADKRRDRVGTDSGPSRGAEKRREEKRTEARRPTLVPDIDCEHGVDVHASCRDCARKVESA